MKKMFFIILIITFLLNTTSCTKKEDIEHGKSDIETNQNVGEQSTSNLKDDVSKITMNNEDTIILDSVYAIYKDELIEVKNGDEIGPFKIINAKSEYGNKNNSLDEYDLKKSKYFNDGYELHPGELGYEGEVILTGKAIVRDKSLQFDEPYAEFIPDENSIKDMIIIADDINKIHLYIPPDDFFNKFNVGDELNVKVTFSSIYLVRMDACVINIGEIIDISEM